MFKKFLFALLSLSMFLVFSGEGRAGGSAVHWYPVRAGFVPQAIVPDATGAGVWFASSVGPYVAHMDPSGMVRYYPTAKPVSSLARDASGNIWFSYYVSGIGYIGAGNHITMKYSGGGYNLTYTRGSIWFLAGPHTYGSTSVHGPTRLYQLPQDFSVNYMAAGPDAHLWITDREHNTIGKVRPGSSLVTAYALTQATFPEAITTGPDGAMWFLNGEGIGRIETKTGNITQYQNAHAVLPGAIQDGPDHTLWYNWGDQGAESEIAYLTPSNGKTTRFINGELGGRGGQAFFAHEGNREWCTDVGGDRIGYYSMATK